MNNRKYKKVTGHWTYGHIVVPEKLIYIGSSGGSSQNRNHTPIETPLEAKNKYLEYGYIPSYIKNDDMQ